MRLKQSLSFLATSITAGLAAAIVVMTFRSELPDGPAQNQPAEPAERLPTPAIFPNAGPVSYAQSVARAAPSVVNIYTTKITTEHKLKPIVDPTLRRHLGQSYELQPYKHLESSLGSGVIVSRNGYLLTNNHIIADADEIEVVLATGKSVPVRIIGSDPDTDLALLKIESGEELPAIAMGDSAALQVGDIVLTIGNPFGVGQTVTMGIVSAKGRSHLGINTYENFIQTDAAINPGNSGGALINAQGEMVGINTAIFSNSGGSLGIGFAIPVQLAQGIMEQIIRHGRVVRGWLGITGQDITLDLVESFGLHDDKGILVSRVLEDGPADKAGIWPGDVITRIDGIAPTDMHHVLNIIANKSPGSATQIEGWRGNDELKIEAVVTERPAQPSKQQRKKRRD